MSQGSRVWVEILTQSWAALSDNRLRSAVNRLCASQRSGTVPRPNASMNSAPRAAEPLIAESATRKYNGPHGSRGVRPPITAATNVRGLPRSLAWTRNCIRENHASRGSR